MTESKSFRLSHLGLAGAFGVLVGGGIFAFIFQDYHKHPLGGANPPSPIKVRGGAMTARTMNSGQWQTIGTDLQHRNIYCSDTDDVSWIDFFEAAGVSSGAIETPTGLPAGWSMKIYGRTYAPATGTTAASSQPSSNGLLLKSQAGGCLAGDTSSFSVILSIYEDDGGSNAQFYKDSATGTDSNGGYAEKFEDMSKGCAGPNGGAIQTGNEDVCERASTIEFTFTPPGGSKSTSIYNCTDGECSIYIGLK